MIHAYPHALTGDHHASGGRHVDSILRWQYKVFGGNFLSQCHHILRCKVLDLAFIKSNSPKVNLSSMTTSVQPHENRLGSFLIHAMLASRLIYPDSHANDSSEDESNRLSLFHQSQILNYGTSESRSSSSHSVMPLSASSRLRSYQLLKSNSGISPP